MSIEVYKMINIFAYLKFSNGKNSYKEIKFSASTARKRNSLQKN